jgi:hypothetical protein
MTWEPDTCGCKFEFDVTFDADKNPTRTLTRVLQGCQHHIGTDEEILAKAKADNRLKNTIVSRAQALMLGKAVKWRFDERRDLVVSGEMDAATRGAVAMQPRVRVE